MKVNKASGRCSRVCLKAFKIIRSPITRLRKLLRKSNMRQMKIAVGVLIIFSCFVTVILYYWYRLSFIKLYGHVGHKEKIIITTEEIKRGTPIKGIPLDELYKDVKMGDERDDLFELDGVFEAKMIDTAGCKIPIVMVDYVKSISNNTKRKVTCGKRAVFLRKVDGTTVQAFIKSNILHKYMKHSGKRFDCCYKFIIQTDELRREGRIAFSNCTKFEDNSKITLQTDFINVQCFEYTDKNGTYTIYDDMFAFTKKMNVSENEEVKCPSRYNVLMIGLDSMSLSRVVQSLPRTMDHFRNDYWISNRGYHKIAENTLPNLMAALTGNNMSTIVKECLGRMDNCNDHMIWSTFKKAGYVTAYGEDYLQLPDTFTNDYEFRKPPTDHYMRPFFLKGERKRRNSTFLCAGMVCSGQQVLDYALDFATFTMAPGNTSYEATVLRKNFERSIIGPISVISNYRGLGKCVHGRRERLFCVCQKMDKC
ncbi:uncharacterized protein LOC142972671 [Anticarsia gemmatalis]|uniref:uncharacterized protein LOC142972671 n=1 Tax=Anticarsia gemmatalis TaxID=129554 RepID=UPI003F767070